MYREFPEADAAVACTWTHRPTSAITHLVVPDGCVDLIWLAGRELVVAGPDTGPHHVSLPAGARSVGVRVRTGAAGSLLGRPAHTACDELVPAGHFASDWGAPLADALAAAEADDAGDAGDAARALLLDAVRRRAPRLDPTVRRAASLLAGHPRTSAVAAELGLTERQLHRRCRDAVGYGPKILARVARLHRLVGSGGTLAERALAAGYSSQSHMSVDVMRLTGLTPVRFLKDSAPPHHLA